MDRISELPDIIIQQILSLLKTKQAAQTSILSKKWLIFWSNRSILHFDQSHFRKKYEEDDEHKYFCKVVEKTLQHHQYHRIHIQKFSLCINKLPDGKFISKWLKIATDSGVGEIHFSTKLVSLLPETIFQEKSLSSLKVSNGKLCLVPSTIVNCHFLKKLVLNHVEVDECLIHSIISSCPLIEKFILSNSVSLLPDTIFQAEWLRTLKVSNATLCLVPGTILNCHFLKKLVLSDVEVDECSIHDMISSFPLIEEIHLTTKSASLLPDTIFKAKSLRKLKVSNAKLCLLPNAIVNCHFLKALMLSNVEVDECSIHNIISSCPLIEKFILSDIRGLETIRVANLFNLKIFFIITSYKFKEVIIDQVPRLGSFICSSSIPRSDLGTLLTIHPDHQSLENLTLRGVSITDILLHKLLSQCSRLQDLTLADCNILERINISSHSLKRFCLVGGEKLVELNIDSPNLLILEIGGDRLSQLSLSSILGQGELHMHISYAGYIDTSRFYELREFLAMFNVSSVLLDINRWSSISFTRDLIPIPFPPQHEIEMLSLETGSQISPSAYPALVDGLFWSCHPKTLCIDWESYNRDFIKFLCDKLEESRNGNFCSCDGQIKCWRCQLQYFDIKNSVRRRSKEWKPVPRESLIGSSLSSRNRYKTHLTLEWNLQHPTCSRVEKMEYLEQHEFGGETS